MIPKYLEKILPNTYPSKIPEIGFNKIVIRISKLLNFEIHGSINIFGKPFHYYRQNINWQTDIFSQRQYPMRLSKTIKIKNKTDISAKAIWEKNRMQFLTLLAIKYKQNNISEDLDILQSIISSWVLQNPYKTGINWYSPHEVNLRLISWFFCWIILDVNTLINHDDSFKKFVKTIWLPSIYQHCQFSYNNKSKHESPHNNKISRYCSLFLACSLWKFPKSEELLNYSKDGLEKEIKKQYSTNGITRESSSGLLELNTDLLLIAYIFSKKTKNNFSNSYKTSLTNIIHYLYTLTDIKGNIPNYGDNDNSKLLLITEDNTFNNLKSIVTTGAILFKTYPLVDKNNIDLKTQILLGTRTIQNLANTQKTESHARTTFYPEEGYFILRSDINGKEIYFHFNAQSLNKSLKYSFRHADALSFVLHINGNPIFIDPGTYCFTRYHKWRKYFRGTLSHNTVKINLKDQAIIGGPFQWLTDYTIAILNSSKKEESIRLKAQHDGYQKQGILHTREIIFDTIKKLIYINDTIQCKNQGFYFIEIPFHLHPDTIIKKNNNINYQITNKKGANLHLILDKKLKTKLIKGQENPQIMGWYSDTFLQKTASPTIYCMSAIEQSTTFQSLIFIQ